MSKGKTEIIIRIDENSTQYSKIIPISKSNLIFPLKSLYTYEKDEFDNSDESEDDSEFDDNINSNIDELQHSEEGLQAYNRKKRGLTYGNIEDYGLIDQTYLKRKHKKKDLTEEEIIRKNDLIIQRKQQMKQQKEDEKKQAIDRILNDEGKKLKEKQRKQQEKIIKEAKDKEDKLRISLTKIKYKINSKTCYIRFPKGILLPKVLHQRKGNCESYPSRRCEVEDCQNNKKYKDPISGKFYCSLPCFNKLRSN